jgi:hypothetical protein
MHYAVLEPSLIRLYTLASKQLREIAFERNRLKIRIQLFCVEIPQIFGILGSVVFSHIFADRVFQTENGHKLHEIEAGTGPERLTSRIKVLDQLFGGNLLHVHQLS